jgi:hypothetical protein
MRYAVLLVLAVVLGAAAWSVLRPHEDRGPQRAVEHWIDSMATGDAREFCASTSASVQASNFKDVGAVSGSCEARAAKLLGVIRPAWSPLGGAYASRASAHGSVASVRLADVVLPDGSRMSQVAFGGDAHPNGRIRLVRSGGAWLVAGAS